MTFNYIEKGLGLHRAITLAGYSLKQVDGVWVADDEAAVQNIVDSYNPLPERQARKWEDIKIERDHRQVSGVKVGDYRYHSDAASRIQQLGLVIMGANIPANLMWKTLEGSFVIMTPSLAFQIFIATALSDQAIFAAAEVHKAAMLQMSNPETYDYSGGWPEA